MAFLLKRNNAVYTNPPVLDGRIADIHITERGSSWLWAVFSIFGLSTLVLLALTFIRLPSTRTFHYLLSIVLLVTTLDYFAQASDLGFVPIQVEFVRRHHTVAGSTRQIWFARYIDYFITVPLLLTTILLISRASWPKIIFVIFFSWTTTVTWLLGALTTSSYKFGFFVFGLFSLWVVAYTLLFSGRRSANEGGSDVGRAYQLPTAYLLFFWLILYPIAWGVSEAGNVIAPNSEMVFYGILDLFTKLGVTALLLWTTKEIEHSRFGFNYYHGSEDQGSTFTSLEKRRNLKTTNAPAV